MSHPATASIPVVDAAHPLRSLGRLLRPYRWRLTGAVVAFGIKDNPVWLLPVITGSVIEIVVDGGPATRLIWIAGGAALLLAIHFPMHLIFVRLFFGSSRALGAELRNGLTSRLQSLSIGFHSRSSAAVIQTKVVRDVENVELLFQQAFPPALTAAFSLIGAVTMTAPRRSPVPHRLSAHRTNRGGPHPRRASPLSPPQRSIPPRGEELLEPGRRDGHSDADHSCPLARCVGNAIEMTQMPLR